MMFRSLLVLLAFAAPAALRAAEPPPRRPNILFVLTDDQRWDLMGCAGHKIIKTPNMDALAAGGVRFRNMFVTTAICAASRASILTGLYERTHRFTFNTPPMDDKFADASYPALLRKAGYRTGIVGKFGIEVNKGVAGRMFDYFKPLNRSPYMKKLPDGTERHLTDIEGDAAVGFLDTVKPGEPFCLSVSFNAPHAEDTDPRQYIWQHSCDDLYKDDVIPTPATMTDEVFNAQAECVRKSESRVRFKWRFDEPAKYQRMVKGYFRMISGVDMVIGRLREELTKRGLADNTIIVFSSDNGYFLGERGLADKWYIYEHSIRVPLIVYDPRPGAAASRGRIEDATVLNVDLAPTFLEMAGAAPASTMQGRSLLPILTGRTPADWRTEFFYEHLFERNNIPKSEGVRTARWSYIRWFEQTPVVEELYDHEADFDEIRNLVGDPKHAEVLAEMRRRTDELRDRWGGPFVPNAIKRSPKPGQKSGS